MNKYRRLLRNNSYAFGNFNTLSMPFPSTHNRECNGKPNKCALSFMDYVWIIKISISEKIQMLTIEIWYMESKHLPEFRWWYFN